MKYNFFNYLINTTTLLTSVVVIMFSMTSFASEGELIKAVLNKNCEAVKKN